MNIIGLKERKENPKLFIFLRFVDLEFVAVTKYYFFQQFQHQHFLMI
jgi:hypothetical protein